MEVKIKIIEFSSDVFSKSNQLKDIMISPLFSNTSFSINIFEAISKNEEYKIKTNTDKIKIGLYNGKSLLGIGDININKKSQKIKITSEDKNKKENNFLNGAFNKVQDNDFYLTLECINNNSISDKNKSISTKDSHKRKKKTASVDMPKNKNNISYNLNKDKGKHDKLNLSLKNYKNDDNIKKTNKFYESRDNINNKKKSNTITYNNNNNYDDENNIKSNSTVIKTDNNKKIKSKLFQDGNSSEQNINNINNSRNTNNDNDEKDSNVNNIFNLSFQKELFSDGVLILSNSNEGDILSNFKNIDINDFDNLINDFYLIYNNVSNNNIFSSMNIKDNFLLEYQYFLEKTSDIINLYSKLSSEINNQNNNIKKYIKNYNNKLKVILKKDKVLKIKKQNIDINELFGLNSYQESKKYYEDEIRNINNKLSLIKNISNDILILVKSNNIKKEMSNTLLKDIFKIIINNENNHEYLQDNKDIINLILNKSKKAKSKKYYQNINDFGNSKDNKKNEDDDKIDLETLKNKIDKLKQQYLNETTTNDYKNKIKIHDNHKTKEKKGKKLYNNSNPNFKNMKTRPDRDNPNKGKKTNNYLNVFTPNGEQRNRITRSNYLDNHI